MQRVGANAFSVPLAHFVFQTAHVSRGKLNHQLWAGTLPPQLSLQRLQAFRFLCSRWILCSAHGNHLPMLYQIHSCHCITYSLEHSSHVSYFFFYFKWCKYLAWLKYRLGTSMHLKDIRHMRGQTRWLPSPANGKMRPNRINIIKQQGVSKH